MAKDYYMGRDPARPITRPNRIPAVEGELTARVDAILSSLRGDAAQHVANAAAELRLQVR